MPVQMPNLVMSHMGALVIENLHVYHVYCLLLTYSKFKGLKLRKYKHLIYTYTTIKFNFSQRITRIYRIVVKFGKYYYLRIG